MINADVITDYRLRVFAARRFRAKVDRMNEANLIARGAEGLECAFNKRRVRDGADIRAARMAIKRASVGRAEHEWLARRAHSAANLTTQRPEASAPLPTT